MANEAVLVQDLEFRHLMVDVAVSGVFLKGSVLGLFDPQVGSVANTLATPFAGIAMEDKVQDLRDTVAVSRHAVWDMVTSGTDTVVAGDYLGISTLPNAVEVISTLTTGSQGTIVGVAMQDGAQSERIQVLVGGR